MRKLLFSLIALVLFAVPAFADNKARIEELSKKVQTTAQTIQQYQQEISKLTQEALIDQGRILELQAQDKAEVKPE